MILIATRALVSLFVPSFTVAKVPLIANNHRLAFIKKRIYNDHTKKKKK